LALAAAAQALSHAVVPVVPLVPPLVVVPLVPPLLPGFGLLPFTLWVPPSPRSDRSIVRMVGDEHAVTSPMPARETPQANMTKRMTNLQGASLVPEGTRTQVKRVTTRRHGSAGQARAPE